MPLGVPAKSKTVVVLALGVLLAASISVILARGNAGETVSARLTVIDHGKSRDQTPTEIALRIANTIYDTPLSEAARTERLAALLHDATPAAVSAATPAIEARWNDPGDGRQRLNLMSAVKPNGDVAVTAVLCTPEMTTATPTRFI